MAGEEWKVGHHQVRLAGMYRICQVEDMDMKSLGCGVRITRLYHLYNIKKPLG